MTYSYLVRSELNEEVIYLLQRSGKLGTGSLLAPIGVSSYFVFGEPLETIDSGQLYLLLHY